MFDVFYIGTKPNLFPHERSADSIDHAREQSRTRYCWIVNYLADYSSFDFLWEPVPWQSQFIHVWPNQWHKYSGTFLVPKNQTEQYHFHSNRILNGSSKTNWNIISAMPDNEKILSWTPPPLDPPYIYVWGNKWVDGELEATAEYHVPGATERKYMPEPVEVLPQWDRYKVLVPVDMKAFDFTWRPDPREPAYIYVWGNQHNNAEVEPTIEYHCPGATERKYMSDRVAQALPDMSKWRVLYPVDSFDFTWRPEPGSPPYFYTWGNQWWPAEKMPTVQYHAPGATEYKFMDHPTAVLSPDKTFWEIPEYIDPSSVDLTWVPDPGDPPYIYEFATQWQPNGGARYVVPGAVEVKYIDIQHRRLPAVEGWQIPDNIDPTSVDTSWHPDSTEQPYIYEFATQWQPNGGARYVVPGATEIKYVEAQHCRLSNSLNWTIPSNIDPNSVDCSWHPDSTEQPYIYEFATQWQPNGGAIYTVPGATERKYVEIQHRRLPDKTPWKHLAAVANFDFSWHPDNTAEPYNYVFGNQHWPGTEMPTLMYCVPGATQETFVESPVAKLWAVMANWEFCEDIDLDAWDWSWVPNPKDPPYIYVFGNQWNAAEDKASLKYHVEGATEYKYMDRRTCRLPQPEQFRHNLAVANFDYSWEPNPFDPPMTYVFGNQWNSAVLEPTVVYSTGGNEIKYMDNIIATVAPDVSAWELLDDIEEFDYSWRPNPTDPPYIYVFGNQWLTPEQRPALQYRVAGATERKYMDHPRARRRGDATKFVQHYPATFDWSWEPDPGSPPYIYVFGNQWWGAEVMPTIEYRMPGATELKYMDHPCATLIETMEHWTNCTEHNFTFDYSWVPDPGDPPYVYVFGNQWHSAEVMPTLKWVHPLADESTPVKYVELPVATLEPNLALWHVPEHVNITDMDFSWVPDPGEPPYIYQFATQHQKTGGPQYRVPGATEVKYVDMMRAEVTKEAAPIIEIDHMDGNAGQIPDTVKKIRYFDNYRDTLIRLAKSLVGQYEHVWVCSSICDYTDFDFTWHPEKWQSTMLHVFASEEQKFGDTFYMHVPTFAERAEKKQLLEWYSVNYVSRKRVPRRPIPVILHSDDSHVEQVKTAQWAGPLALFTTEDYVDRPLTTVPLWREETKTIAPIASGATSVVVPKVAVPYIKTQLYDYPNIDKTKVKLKSKPLDIVFISNGETEADWLYTWLEGRIEDLEPNRLVRVDGVKGRVAAYQAAARASTTPWFFAVFAKLQVDFQFDWSWQPDRMQQPKHYIFHAHNPINDLIYGHQAMIAYNRKLVLENTGEGLDFTLDQPHEVVPILSGTAQYHTSNWMCWRTAFREALKLRASLPDVENEYRLQQWLTKDNTLGQWSRKGAEDAVEYYDSVNGDFAELKKSYEWDWLSSYAFIKRGLAPSD